MPQLDPSSFLSQLFWLALSFALLYVVLAHLLLPRLGAILEHRQQTIEKGLAEARQFRDQAQSAFSDYQSALAGARSESATIMQAASALYQKESTEKLTIVEREIEAKLQKADAELAVSRDKAKAEAKEVSIAMAQDIVKIIAGFEASPQSLGNLIQETC